MLEWKADTLDRRGGRSWLPPYRRGAAPGPLRSLTRASRFDPLLVAIIAVLAMASALAIPALLGRQPNSIASKPSSPALAASVPAASPSPAPMQQAVSTPEKRIVSSPSMTAALPAVASEPPPAASTTAVAASASRTETGAAKVPPPSKPGARAVPPTLSLDMLPVLDIDAIALEAEAARPVRRAPGSQRRTEAEPRPPSP